MCILTSFKLFTTTGMCSKLIKISKILCSSQSYIKVFDKISYQISIFFTQIQSQFNSIKSIMKSILLLFCLNFSISFISSENLINFDWKSVKSISEISAFQSFLGSNFNKNDLNTKENKFDIQRGRIIDGEIANSNEFPYAVKTIY